MKQFIKNLSDKYKVGDEIEVIIVKPKEGKFPIGKTPDSGVTFTFEFGTKKYFEYDSTWLVKITAVKSKNLIGVPIREVQSAESNNQLMKDKLELLLNKYKS